jgi:hypothetical protein
MATGIDVRFAQEHKAAGRAEAAADDYRGVRRVIGADVAETLARAGI